MSVSFFVINSEWGMEKEIRSFMLLIFLERKVEDFFFVEIRNY